MALTSQRAIPLALIVIVALLLAARIVSAFVKTAPAGAVQWLSIEDGMARARATNKPILFDFTAEWCGPCHQLDAAVFQNADFARRINAGFIAVRVVDRQQEDGENRPEVAALQKQYAVRAFPTLVFTDSTGNERGRMEGFRGADQFERVMEQSR
ncbi:MAG TPA: thioredoxin fold domain-containing protein [Thermoanaerobaculia bacterium]|jgi:thiol:disulfide interchange protein